MAFAHRILGSLLVFLLLTVAALPAWAEDIQAFITQNTTWTAEDGPYNLIGDVTVAPHVTLTIEPGTEITTPGGDTIQGNTDSGRVEFIVAGKLIAEGTEESPIQFGSGNAGSWYGVRFNGTVAGSKLRYVNFRGTGAKAVLVQGTTPPTLANLEFSSGSGIGIEWTSSVAPSLSKLSFSSMSGKIINVTAGTPIVLNEIEGSSSGGIQTSVADAQVSLSKVTLSSVSGNGIETNAPNPVFSDVTVKNASERGIYCSAPTQVTMTDVNVEQSNSDGIYLVGSDGAQANLTNVRSASNDGDGIEMTTAFSTILTAVEAAKNAGTGIIIPKGQTRADRLEAWGNRSDGLRFTGGLVLTSSVFYANDSRGIHGSLVLGYNVYLTNNTVDQNWQSGIYTSGDPGGVGMTFKNNIITSNNRYGIEASGLSPTLLHNNVWNNNSGNYANATADQNSLSVNPLYRQAVLTECFTGSAKWCSSGITANTYADGWIMERSIADATRIRLVFGPDQRFNCNSSDYFYVKNRSGNNGSEVYRENGCRNGSWTTSTIIVDGGFSIYKRDYHSNNRFDLNEVLYQRKDDMVRGDYRLQPGSPVADKGSNQDAPATDFNGFTRDQDGDFDGNSQIDMGALEFYFNAQPVAAPGQDETVHLNQEVAFDGSGSSDADGTVDSYAWDFGDGNSAEGPLATHSFGQLGTYTVTLTVTDNYGDSTSESISVTVEPAPVLDPNQPPVADGGRSRVTQAGVATSFSAADSVDPDGNIVSYQWAFGDGTVGSGVEVEHTYTEEGLFTVVLVVTDDDGAAASTTITVDVSGGFDNDAPSANAGNDRVVQLDAEVTFSGGASTDDGRITDYEWTFGDGNTGTGIVTNHTYTEVGQFNVTLKVTDDFGATDTDSLSLRVNAPPTADAGPDRAAPLDAAVSFSAAASTDADGSIAEYYWQFGDGTGAEGAEVSHTYQDVGIYIVRLTVVDNDGALGEDLFLVTVEAEAGVNAPPSASAGADQVVQFGERVTLSGGGSSDTDGRIVSYSWDFGDGETGAGLVVNHTYGTQGIYTVSLTVTDDGGDSASDTLTVTVNGAPQANAGADRSVEIGQGVLFDGSASADQDGRIVQYLWDFGDENATEGQQVEHHYAQAGVYLARLTVTDNQGGTDTDLVVVTVTEAAQQVNQRPTADAGQARQADVGDQVVFSAEGAFDSDGRIVRYDWNFGDGTSAQGLVVSHTYQQSGRFVVQLTVTDDEGAEASDTTTVDVNAPPSARAGGNQVANMGVPVTFDAGNSSDLDGEIVSYAWDFGDGSQGIGEVTTHTYAQAGSYLVTLTVTDDQTATAEDVALISVLDGDGRPGNLPPVADAGADQLVTRGERAMLVGANSFDSDGRIVSYEWDFGDGNTDTGAVVFHEYALPGSYIATLVVTDDRGESAESTTRVTVNSRPTADAGDDRSAGIDEPVRFDGTASRDTDGRIVTYTWDFGDGSAANGAAVDHAYAAAGSYLATLTVTDDRDAQAVDTLIVTVTAAGGAPSGGNVVAVAGEDQVVEAGEEIVFDGTGSSAADGTIVGYSWNLGDGNIASGAVVRHSYAISGVFDVELTVTSSTGAEGKDTVRIRVNTEPVARIAQGDRETTEGEAVRFDGAGSSDEDGGIVSYVWDFGDGAQSAGQQAAHVFEPGMYTVTLTVTDNDGATASDSVEVTVEADPDMMGGEGGAAGSGGGEGGSAGSGGEGGSAGSAGGNEVPIVNAGGNVQANAGEEVTFSAAGTVDVDGVILSYVWDFGDGASGSGMTANHTYQRGGMYTVTLTVIDNGGATAMATVTATINGVPSAKISADPVSALVGEDVVFDASESSDDDGEIAEYRWDFGDGVEAEGATVTHAYPIPGLFTITLTLVDDIGAEVTKTRAFTVREAPAASDGGCATSSSPLPYSGYLLIAAVLIGLRWRRRHDVKA